MDQNRVYNNEDYVNAVLFALNYPPDIDYLKYDEDKDIYIVAVFDEGWYEVKLHGFFVRSCLKWEGKKQWKQDG